MRNLIIFMIAACVIAAVALLIAAHGAHHNAPVLPGRIRPLPLNGQPSIPGVTSP